MWPTLLLSQLSRVFLRGRNMIYFVQAEIIGRIKIGHTSGDDAADRLAALQTACPVPLRLIATRPGGRRKERELHGRFAAARVCGEWFDPVPELVRYIGRLQGQAIRRKTTRLPRATRAESAAEWLTAKFRERAEWPAEDLYRVAKSEGVSRDAIFEAKRRLGLPRARRTQDEGGNIAYVWWVPADWPLADAASSPNS